MIPRFKAHPVSRARRAAAGLAAVSIAITALASIRVDLATATDAERLAEIRLRARTNPTAAASDLRAMDPAPMNPTDRDAWHAIARSVALRTGDREWLASLADHEPEFSEVHLYRVLLAGGLLEEGKIDQARAELAKIDDIEAVNARDRRRLHALEARIAWLEGDPAAERAAIDNIALELQHWDTPSCQRCHSDPAHPDQTPLLDVRSAWYAQRLVTLMQAQGDAQAVHDLATSQLATNPADLNARLHLGYASLALGLERQADDHFAQIPWMKLPGRTGASPRMMIPYP